MGLLARAARVAAAIKAFAAAAAFAAQPAPPSPPPPPPPPPYVHACTVFPASVIGTRTIGAYPTLLAGPWLTADLTAADLEALAVLLETQFGSVQPGSPDFHEAAIAELHAATIRNLRSELPIGERARRQRLDYRIGLRSLRNPLSAPIQTATNSSSGHIIEAIGMITWLLNLKEAQSGGQAGLESFLDLLEPLEAIVGMGTVEAMDYFTDPLREIVLQDDLEFVLKTMGRPASWKGDTFLPRSLLISLNQARPGPAAQTLLFRKLDGAVRNYFKRVARPWVSRGYMSSRPEDETERLLANAQFLAALQAGRFEPAASEPDDTAGPPCR